MKKIIEIKNLAKSFGKKEVLTDINFSVAEYERVSIIGKNGSGKSTLINSIIGTIQIDKGEILFPVHGSRQEFLNNLGIQFQDSTYPRGYTIDEIINMVHDLNFKGTPNQYKKFIEEKREPMKEELLKVFGLDPFIKTKTHKLSGGQQQKLNILLALIKKPKILILDEITTGLDIEAKHKLIKYINGFVNENKITLIIISHMVVEMESLVDRVILIDEGKILDDISFKQIKSKYKSLENYVNEFFIKNKKPINKKVGGK
jgi:ABC-2 type transport system ATP-binding protein